MDFEAFKNKLAAEGWVDGSPGTTDLARRLSEHGEEWFRTVECLPVGARAEALAFETKVKQRYSSRSMRKGTEDFPLTFTEVESLRKELKAEHQRTRPKEKEGQQPVQVQPVKQEEGSEIDLDEFWSVVGALFLLVAVIGVLWGSLMASDSGRLRGKRRQPLTVRPCCFDGRMGAAVSRRVRTPVDRQAALRALGSWWMGQPLTDVTGALERAWRMS
jgi:hypothetical protein